MQFLKVVQCQLDLIPAKRNQSANSCRNSNVQETINVIAVPVGIFCADTIYICLAHIDNCLCAPGAYRQLSVCARRISTTVCVRRAHISIFLAVSEHIDTHPFCPLQGSIQKKMENYVIWTRREIRTECSCYPSQNHHPSLGTTEGNNSGGQEVGSGKWP